MNLPARAPTAKAVARMAAPIALANLATPMLHVVDAAAVGRLDDPVPLAAVALATLVFNFLYWAFGFLRMGAAGPAAIALGAGDLAECQATLARASALALAGGLLLVVAQAPLAWFAREALQGSARVEAEAQAYFAIRIWSAPAALVIFALSGWLIGVGRAGGALALQAALNGVNAALDFTFVIGFGWGVRGVAAGTLIAEILAVVVGIFVVRRVRAGWPKPDYAKALRRADAWRKTLALNADIFIRTLCLLFAFAWFTNRAAGMGDVELAATSLLLHMLTISAFFLDAFAFTAESFVGQAKGARAAPAVHAAARKAGAFAALTACLLTGAFLLGGAQFVSALTVNQETRALAVALAPWAALTPLTAFACFTLDGVFIGAAASRAMRDMMLVALAGFIIAERALAGFGLAGLWAALHIFFLLRALTLGARYPALLRSIRAGAPKPS